MTTCAKALQAWAAKEETPLEDAKIVKIYAQIPPINKLDNSLNQLVNCERLALSTNAIDRLIPLPGLKSIWFNHTSIYNNLQRGLCPKFREVPFGNHAKTTYDAWGI